MSTMLVCISHTTMVNTTMNNPPGVPMLTGDDHVDLVQLYQYMHQLVLYITTGEPDIGWTTTGLSTNKTLLNGDTLAITQNFIGTLVGVLKSKGVLS